MSRARMKILEWRFVWRCLSVVSLKYFRSVSIHYQIRTTSYALRAEMMDSLMHDGFKPAT